MKFDKLNRTREGIYVKPLYALAAPDDSRGYYTFCSIDEGGESKLIDSPRVIVSESPDLLRSLHRGNDGVLVDVTNVIGPANRYVLERGALPFPEIRATLREPGVPLSKFPGVFRAYSSNSKPYNEPTPLQRFIDEIDRRRRIDDISPLAQIVVEMRQQWMDDPAHENFEIPDTFARKLNKSKPLKELLKPDRYYL